MDYAKIIEAIKGARWYLVILLFAAFVLNLYKDDVSYFLRLTAKKEFKDPVVEVISRDMLIDASLEDMMKRASADRAYIFRFHNGQNYFDGTHKVKMSCDYEVVSAGIAPQAQSLVDIPTSLYSWWLNEIIEGRMFYQDIDSIPDLTTRVALENQGTKSIAVFPYFSKSGKLIALIGLNWVGRPASLFEIMRRQGKDEKDFNYKQQNNFFRQDVNGIGKLLDKY